MRLAVLTPEGYPAIASLWYIWHQDALWCVTHRDAWLVKRLQADPRIGFEIAVNEMPYKGVRGQANATLLPELGPEILELALTRYLGGGSRLGAWLRSRATEEVAIRLDVKQFSTWDYSERMADITEPSKT